MPRLTHKEIDTWFRAWFLKRNGRDISDFWNEEEVTQGVELLWDFQAHLQDRGVVAPDVKKAQKGRRP